MLRRKLYQNLLSWCSARSRKALLLTGARQVGKSTRVRKLGNESYDRLVEINLALNDAAREALAGSRDIGDFLRRVCTVLSGISQPLEIPFCASQKMSSWWATPSVTSEK